MADDNIHTPQDFDDVKRSFAWGQLFAGSLIGGIAVWKLLHKMTNTEPSAWFAGLSRAYEEVRDFLMTPFDCIQLNLTADEKSLLVVCLVVYGGVFRALAIVPRGVFWPMSLLAPGVLIAVVSVFGLFWDGILGLLGVTVALDLFRGALGIRFWIVAIAGSALYLAAIGSIYVIGIRRIDPNDRALGTVRAFQRLTLFNVLFTALWGTALLLLNWATA